MQNGFQTTPLNRSVTPVPYPRHMAHGSSLSSLNSTNPFDDDDDTVSRVTTIDGMTVRKPGRKKRRAPPPPTMAASIVSFCLSPRFFFNIHTLYIYLFRLDICMVIFGASYYQFDNDKCSFAISIRKEFNPHTDIHIYSDKSV